MKLTIGEWQLTILKTINNNEQRRSNKLTINNFKKGGEYENI